MTRSVRLVAVLVGATFGMCSPSVTVAQESRLVDLSGKIAVEDGLPVVGNGEWFLGGILSTGDVNNDGTDDLLLSIGTIPDRKPKFALNAAKPILLVYNNASRRYEKDEAFAAAVPPMNLARNAFVGDLNGDGLSDVFIGGLGVDELDFACGEKSVLMLQQSGGGWQQSDQLTEKWSFTHSLVPANFDSDPAAEILVVNQNTGGRRCVGEPLGVSYLLNYSGGEFRREQISICSGELNQRDPNSGEIATAGYFDRAADGSVNLVLMPDGEARVFERDATGQYRRTASFKTTKAFRKEASNLDCWRPNGKCFIAHSYVLGADIDSDGSDELVVSYYGPLNTKRGMHRLQVLDRGESGEWEDVTDSVIPKQNKLEDVDGWCFKLSFEDFTGDGKRDILCTNQSLENVGMEHGFLYVNEGEQYVLKTLGELADNDVGLGQLKRFSRVAYPMPVTINGKRWLIGIVQFADRNPNLLDGVIVTGVRLR